MSRVIGRVLVALLLVLGLAGITGCEADVEPTEENVVGIWQASLNNVGMKFNIRADGTFGYVNQYDGGSFIFMNSGFLDIPGEGKWRLTSGSPPELVLMEVTETGTSATVASPVISGMTADTMSLEMPNKPPNVFRRTH